MHLSQYIATDLVERPVEVKTVLQHACVSTTPGHLDHLYVANPPAAVVVPPEVVPILCQGQNFPVYCRVQNGTAGTAIVWRHGWLSAPDRDPQHYSCILSYCPATESVTNEESANWQDKR